MSSWRLGSLLGLELACPLGGSHQMAFAVPLFADEQSSWDFLATQEVAQYKCQCADPLGVWVFPGEPICRRSKWTCHSVWVLTPAAFLVGISFMHGPRSVSAAEGILFPSHVGSQGSQETWMKVLVARQPLRWVLCKASGTELSSEAG